MAQLLIQGEAKQYRGMVAELERGTLRGLRVSSYRNGLASDGRQRHLEVTFEGLVLGAPGTMASLSRIIAEHWVFNEAEITALEGK